MTALITVQDASVGYGGDLVLRDLSLTVSPGEILAVVGESGSGKSTLGKLITGQLHPSHGTVEVLGRPWRAIRQRDAARHRVQMIFQDSRDALNPWMSALATVAEAVGVVDGLRRSAAQDRARELLGRVGLTGSTITRKPALLSGGQCQRVGIARALAHHPSVLVADEPTSALDVSVQAQVLTLLRQLRAEEGLAVVLITHDLNVVRSVADRVQVLYQGRLLEAGPTAELLEAPQHPYSRLLVDSRPGVRGLLPIVQEDVVGHPCAFAARCPVRQADCTHLDYRAMAVTGSSAHAAACLHPLPGSLPLLSVRPADATVRTT